MENPDPHEVGLRLRAVLRKLGAERVKTMARLINKPPTVVGNWLNGYSLPKLSSMRELTQRLPGLTLEWIYWGDDRLVPAQLGRELGIFVEMFRQQLEPWEVEPGSADSVAGGGSAPRKPAEHAA